MSEWKNVKVEDILLVPSRNGLTKPSAIRGKGVKMIAMGELFAHPIIRDIETDRVPVTEKELQSSNIEVDDLLFARQSLTLEGAGKCSIIKEVKEPTVFESHLIRLRINKKLADSWFVYYYFNSYKGKHSIQNIVNQVAAAGIKGSDLVKLVIPLPPLDVQKGISSTLLDFDDKIAVNRRICENLEAQAQALFKHWFIDFAPFKNGKFVESELGMIPEGWRVGTLGEICKTNKRTLSSKNTPDVIEYLDTGNITANRIDNIQILHKGQDKIPSRAKRLVSEGDIIFSAVRPNQRHYGLLMNPSPSLVVSTGFVVITANWSGFRYFIYHFLIQNSIIETLQAIGEQSVSTYPSINANDIESLKLIIPKMEDVEDFADICCNFYCKIESIEDESTRLSTLRDALLPKLMSGQIKV